MTRIPGFFYDGVSSARRPAWLELSAPGRVHIQGDAFDRHYALAQLRISAPLGKTPRKLYLPEGALFESDDALLDAVLTAPAGAAWLHRWESRSAYALLSLGLTVATLWVLATYGIPALAKPVAFSLPAVTEAFLGHEALEALDRLVLAPSALPDERQRQIHALFDNVVKGLEDALAYRLELRKGGRVGANALALPAGIVVMTDELVGLAQGDEELIGVLAHEIGHIQHRHTLRHTLQHSLTALVLITLTGDVSSASALAATLPALLMEARYSQDFEREADQFAFEHLRRHGISPQHLGRLLSRLGQSSGSSAATPNFLSSHPSTEKRLEYFSR